MAARTVSVREFFDTTPFTPYQVWVCFLCFCVVCFDGFDLTMMAVTMPMLGKFLEAGPESMGLALSAGMLGPLVGALVLGSLADRLGRKRMLVICGFVFGVFTLLITQISNDNPMALFRILSLSGVQQLALLRFLAGVGLGGAIPNALAFGCEYAPTRLRATLTTMMWAGMPIGSAINGLVAAYLLPKFGWQSLFIVGGVAPLVIGIVVWINLPDSLEFLVKEGIDKAKILNIVSRISPSFAREEVQLYSADQKLPGVPVKHLFMEGRALTTLLLWAAFFGSFYLIWIILAWAPTLLKQSGASTQQFSMAFFFINLGSAIATITIGRLMDKFNRFVVVMIAQGLAFCSFVAFGYSAGSSFLMVAVVCVISGFFIFASNSGVMALGTVSYPVNIRASGLGWAYAVGKIGTMVAPAVGGYCIKMKLSPSYICSANGGAALFVMVVVLVLWKHLSAKAAREAATQAQVA